MVELSGLDKLLCGIDTAIRTLIVPDHRQSNRNSPAQALEEASLSTKEKAHVAGLMRVNHAGEVCAQALYQGQAMTAKLGKIRDQMTQAAAEEVDHLAWCEERLHELNSQPSLLNPLWYTGSFLIGALAGLAGDRWSLGFVAETERQVSRHLERHLQHLPVQDTKSEAILKMMQEDEEQHAALAIEAGAAELPPLIKQCMQKISKLMTESSYHI